MRSVSNNYKNYIDSSLVRKPKSKVVINGNTYDGETYLVSYPKIAHHSEKAAGCFPAATCEFEIFNRNGNLSLFGKEVTVYRGLEINGTVNWVQVGLFSAEDEDIKININKRTISFKGTDRTRRFDKPYGGKAQWESNNRKIHQILSEICIRNGVSLKTTRFPMSDYLFPGIPPSLDFDNLTDRQMISSLAELCGCIAVITSNGSLHMKSVTETNMTISKYKYKSLSIGNPLGPINTVSFGHADYEDALVKMQVGVTEATKIEWAINDNPLTGFTDDGVKEALLNLVSNNYFGRTFIPFELVDFIDDYIYELNDGVTIEKKDGSTVSVAILDISNQSRIKSNFKAAQQSPGKTDMALAGGIKEAVKKVQLTVDHINNIIETLATDNQGLETRITQTDSEIRAFIANEKEGLQTQITANADGVSSLTSKVEEMKIGSRNLLVDSSCFETRYHSAYNVTKGMTATGNEPSLPSEKYRAFTITANSTSSRRGISFKTESSAAPLGNPQNIKPQTTYTLTFWAKISSGEKTLSRSDLVSSSFSVSSVSTSSLVLGGAWNLFRYTFKTGTGTNPNSSFQIRFYFPMEANEEITLYLSSLQLEESTVPSDWHKNDADIAAEFMTENDVAGLLSSSIGDYLTDYVKSSTITSLSTEFNTAIQQTNGLIALKADQTTVTTLQNKVNDHETLIATNTAAIETKANQILSTVSSNYYLKTSATALENNMKSYTDTAKADAESYADGVGATIYANAKSYINQQADSIKLAVEKNIRVGAVNLLYNSDCFAGYQESYYRSVKNSGYPKTLQEVGVPSKSSNCFSYKCNASGGEVGAYFEDSNTSKLLACDFSEIVPNEKYTFSFWAKGTGNSVGKTISRAYLLRFGATSESEVPVSYDTSFSDDIVLTAEWKRYRVTFSVNKTPTAFRIRFWHIGVKNTNYMIYVSSFKLESGSLMTDWQLNGQEYASAAEIDMCVKTDENDRIVSMINASADEIHLTSDRFFVESDDFSIGDGKITSGASDLDQSIIENGHIDFFYNGTRSYRLGQTADGCLSVEDKNNYPRFFVSPIESWGNDNIPANYRTVIGAWGGLVLTADDGDYKYGLVLDGREIYMCGPIIAYNDISARTLVDSPKYCIENKAAMRIHNSEFAIGMDTRIMKLYAKDKIKCTTPLYNSSGNRIDTSSVEGLTTITDTGEIIIPDDFMDYFANSEVTISPTQILTTASHSGGTILHENEETGEIIEEPIIIPEKTERVEAGVDFTSADTTPDILLSDDGVNVFSMMCLTWKGVQNLHERLTVIENSLNQGATQND